jgi:transcriptional regulator with XRE-family HTH domain
MERKELIQSKEYWLAKLQIDLFNEVEAYMKANNLNRTQFAEKLGVSKSYVSQILNGEADHRLSKFVELALSIDLCPIISFEKVEDMLHRDYLGLHDITEYDIERSKTILQNLDCLPSNSPINKSHASTNWKKFDIKNYSYKFQEAS